MRFRSGVVGSHERPYRVSIEAGGNAPFIVFDDADIPAAVEGASNTPLSLCGRT